MFKDSVSKLALVLIVAAALSGFALCFVPMSAAQQPAVTRKILQKTDAPVPGYDVVMVAVEIPAGGREGRHTHPGLTMIYVQEGVLTFDCEGKPTATYKAGDSLYVEPDKIHEGQNHGTAPVKVLATFVVKKGVAMTTQVP